GDLGDGGLAPQLVAELLARTHGAHVVLLETTGHADGPGAVAEVALDLADDRRGREGAELVLQRRVEPLDGLDQAEEADLLDVLLGLTAIDEAPREVVDQVGVELDEAVAD